MQMLDNIKFAQVGELNKYLRDLVQHMQACLNR